MGRKKKEKVGLFDRIGEEVNLEKCPECLDHPDCFSCLEGRCTALSESGGRSCVFYKRADKGIKECKEAYQRLKDAGRYDLIQKYIKAFTAFGFLDEEIEEELRSVKDLDLFRDSDFESLMDHVDQTRSDGADVQDYLNYTVTSDTAVDLG